MLFTHFVLPKNLDLPQGCESIVSSEAIWFWLLPLGLESIIVIIIIIWNKVGSMVHSSPTPPHPAHSYTVVSALLTENTFLSPLNCLGTFLKNQQEWSVSGPTFYSTDVCYIHIILVLVFLIIPLICFLFSPMTYYLTCALFGGLLLNFQPFWDLLDVIVLLVHTILVREHILYVSVLWNLWDLLLWPIVALPWWTLKVHLNTPGDW